MPDSTWRKHANLVLEGVFIHGSVYPGMSDRQLRAILVAAYPFGERKFWPYKVWLDARRRWIRAFRAGRLPPVYTPRRRPPDTETLPLLP